MNSDIFYHIIYRVLQFIEYLHMCKYSDSIKCWSKCKNIWYRRCVMIHRWCKVLRILLNVLFYGSKSTTKCVLCTISIMNVNNHWFDIFALFFMRINFLSFSLLYGLINSIFLFFRFWLVHSVIFVYESIPESNIICNGREKQKIVVNKKRNNERSLFALSFRFA